MQSDCRRYDPYVFPQYYSHERNGAFNLAHVSRPDPRTCLLNTSGHGMRPRGGQLKDEELQEATNHPRRRIAVACARCRKRKIRCSGDPGDGSGCLACKQAGVDVSQCQFHRVGSTDALTGLTTAALANLLPHSSNQNNPIPLYSPGGSLLYHRLLQSAQYTPQVDTKSAVYTQTWTVPCPEDTGPTEPYSLDQASGYMQNSNVIMGMYGANYQWSQANQRMPLSRPSVYLEDQNNTASYSLGALPVLQTSNLQPATNSEALSPLNMTSLQPALPLSLPMRPHPQATAPRRQLPVPQPSPARRARNAVDILQDQRLRSVQSIPGVQMHPFAKPTLTWSSDSSNSDIQSTPSSEASSTDIVPHNATTGAINIPIGYSGTKTSTKLKQEPVTASTQPRLSFSTSPLVESMPTVAGTATYSNFRNYVLPTSSSTDTLAVLARPSSQSNMYSFSTDSAAKRTARRRSSNEGALISGQQYTPLQPSEAPHSVERKSQPSPVHQSSMPTLNRSF